MVSDLSKARCWSINRVSSAVKAKILSRGLRGHSFKQRSKTMTAIIVEADEDKSIGGLVERD